jgi:hypothetical protein
VSRSRRTPLERALRALRHVVLDQSREGRAAEIVAWSNGLGAVAVAGAVTVFGWSRFSVHSAWIGLAAGALALVVLRLALTHRSTVWLAAAVGTTTIAALGGSLAWLFGHVVEVPAVPLIAAALGALLAALAPAWSYAHFARRRASDVRDSLVEPVSVPSSR